MTHTRDLSGIIDTFAAGDYVECHRLIHEQPPTSYLEVFLGLICLVRLGQREVATQVSTGLQEHLRPPSWPGVMLAVLLGEMSPGEAFSFVEDPRQAAQLHFYAGEFLRNIEREDLATRAYRKCVETGAEGPERLIAERLLVRPNVSNEAAVFERLGEWKDEAFRALAAGSPTRAIEIARHALAFATRHCGSKSGAAGLGYNMLGLLFQQTGDWSQTESHCAEGLRLLEPRAGAEHPLTLECLHGLAVATHNLGRLEEAERFYLLAIERRTHALGPDEHATLESIDSLSYLYEGWGEFPAARLWLQKVLDSRVRTLGAGHERTLSTVDSMATLLERMEDLGAALPLRRLAVEERRRVRGRWHRFTLESDVDLLRLLFRMGDRAAVVSLVRRMIDEAHECPAELKANVAVAFEDVSKTVQGVGEYGLLVEVRHAQLPLTQEAHGADSPHVVTITSTLAYALHQNGDLLEAERLSEAVLDRRRSLGHADAEIALACNNLAQVYQSQGRFADAVPLMTEALRLDQLVHGPRHTDVAGDHNNLGIAFSHTGRLADAKYHIALATEIWREVYPQGHERLAAALSNLASIYFALRDPKSGEPLLRKALKMSTRLLGAGHPDTARLMTCLASLESRTQQYAEAVARAREALASVVEKLGERHPRAMSAALTLAEALSGRTETRAEAEEILAQVVPWLESDPAAEVMLVIEGLMRLGELRAAGSDVSAAETAFRRAAEVCRQRCGPDASGYVEVLRRWGSTRAELGDAREALRLLCEAAEAEDRLAQQASAVGSRRQRETFLAAAQNTHRQILWLVCRRLADDREAVLRAFDFVLRRKALASALLERHHRWRFHADAESRALLSEWEWLKDRIAEVFLVAPDAPLILSASQQIDGSESRCEQIEEALAQRFRHLADPVFDVPSTRQALADALPLGAALVEFVLVESFDSSEWGAVRTLLERVGHEKVILAFVLRHGSPDDVRLFVLPHNTTYNLVADFLVGVTGDQSWVKYRWFQQDLNGKLVPREKTALPWREVGRALAAAVFDPLLPALQGCDRLVIAPDGLLAHVPFEILPLDGGGLLCDRFRTSYVGAGRDLLRPTEGLPLPAAPPAVVAAPDYDLTAPGRFVSRQTLGAIGMMTCGQRFLELLSRYEPLDGAAEEGEVVGKILGVKPLTGAEATRRAVLALSSPRLLHLATHGYAPDGMMPKEETMRMLASLDFGTMGKSVDPLYQSGLALTGINWKSNIIRHILATSDPSDVEESTDDYFRQIKHDRDVISRSLHAFIKGDDGDDEDNDAANPATDCLAPPPDCGDGRLTAADINRMDLRGTEVVTLSACVTALGVLRDGDGVQGLTRSFLISGARTVVSSLWNVPDRQTVPLMREFYRGLMSGADREEALWTAREKLRKRYPDQPRYWAAFVLYGDWGPLLDHHQQKGATDVVGVL
jgi:tetratricopeptide (TPR) repeat protein